jgi:superfamily II DNA or RNA helicase
MQLRPYQQECVDSVFRAWLNYDKVLIVLATGAGKTIIMSDIISKLTGNVLFLAHRELLVEQFGDKLMSYAGLSCSYLIAGRWEGNMNGSIDAVLRDSAKSERVLRNGGYDYIFIDEAHGVMGDTYREIISWYPKAKVLGVTATPDRSDKKELGEVFEVIPYEYLLDRAIKEGYCVPIKVVQIPLEKK